MRPRAGHSPRRPLTVGLALFGLFFQLFLPVSIAAAAEPGAPNRILEICAADGIVRVPLPAHNGADGAAGAQDAGEYVEACNHCVLHAAHFFLPSRGPDTAARPVAGGARLTLSISDRNPGSAARAGFDARGPPMPASFRATA